MKQKERITHHVFMEFLKKQRAQKESCLTIPFTCCLWYLLTWGSVVLSLVWLCGTWGCILSRSGKRGLVWDFFLFRITFLLVIIFHSNVAQCYMTREGVVQDLHRIEVAKSANETANPITLSNFNSRDEVWKWLSDGFVPRLNGGVIKTYNHIVGSVVVSQTRAKRAQCDVDSKLQAFYGSDCFPVDNLLDSSFPEQGEEFVAGGGLSSGVPTRFYAWLNFWGTSVVGAFTLFVLFVLLQWCQAARQTLREWAPLLPSENPRMMMWGVD